MRHIRERQAGHLNISSTAFFLLTPPSHLFIVRSPLRHTPNPHPPSKDLGTKLPNPGRVGIDGQGGQRPEEAHGPRALHVPDRDRAAIHTQPHTDLPRFLRRSDPVRERVFRESQRHTQHEEEGGGGQVRQEEGGREQEEEEGRGHSRSDGSVVGRVSLGMITQPSVRVNLPFLSAHLVHKRKIYGSLCPYLVHVVPR